MALTKHKRKLQQSLGLCWVHETANDLVHTNLACLIAAKHVIATTVLLNGDMTLWTFLTEKIKTIKILSSLANDFLQRALMFQDIFLFETRTGDEKMTRIVSNVSVCYTFFREK